LHRYKNEHTTNIHSKDGDSGVGFTLGRSEEAQKVEQKSRRKRKQIRSTANPRSTPAPRKKNCTARSPSKEVRRVGESEQIRSGRTERKPDGRQLELAAHHNQTLAGISRERGGKKRGDAGTGLYRPWFSRRGRAGGTFPSPERARQGHPSPAQSARKSPAQCRAKPSPSAMVKNGVPREPGGEGQFGPRRPGRGRGRGSQTQKWAPGSAPEPTGHPFKHALHLRHRRYLFIFHAKLMSKGSPDCNNSKAVGLGIKRKGGKDLFPSTEDRLQDGGEGSCGAKYLELSHPPRRRQATRGERPAAAGLAAAARFLAPIPPHRWPSSRWQGGGGPSFSSLSPQSSSSSRSRVCSSPMLGGGVRFCRWSVTPLRLRFPGGVGDAEATALQRNNFSQLLPFSDGDLL
jgi:hypothetical protein